MTTEMKQLLALLLMACAFTVRGDPEVDYNPCTNGIGALIIYKGYRGCSGSKPHRYVADFMSSIGNNVTVDSLIHLFSNYCSTVFPKLGPCFQKNIEDCTSSQRNTLMSLANQTGFACEPGTNRTNPVLQHLFSRLTSADLAVNDQCNDDEELHSSAVCLNRSLEAAGLPYANFREVIDRLSAEELVPKFRAFAKTMVNCTVTHNRDNAEHCSAWRGKAILRIRYRLLPSVLGHYMTFTTADIDTMFGWPHQSQVQITG